MPFDPLRKSAAFVLLLALTAPSPAAPPAEFAKDVQPVLAAFCVKCHGKTKPRGGVDLSVAADDKTIQRQRKLWQRVIEQLRTREMPPAKAPQPTAAQRDLVAGLLARALVAGEGGEPSRRDPGPSPAHRLSRTEYDRTIRDLVGIDFPSGDLVGMPSDSAGGGFDNLARRLTLAPAQLEKYFTAADRILERILGRPDGTPSGEDFHRQQALQARNRLLFVHPSAKLLDRDAARQIIARFARRAYRRPVEEREIDRLLQLYDLARKKSDSHDNGVRLMLKAVLVSPHFLLKVEKDRAPAGDTLGYAVSDHELAVRLSYFLWSTMPDEKLSQLADDKKLSYPDVLRQQVQRMLADPRARALTENFGVPWLQLRKVWDARPSQEFFPDFSHHLRASMYDEAAMFFGKLREENRSVLELLDADYTYANETLAKHYGLPPVAGGELRKVSLRPGDHRGGLLAMAGILTMTSHTSRTSPTLRGKWVLDVIFGTPPPPPPPDPGMIKEDKEKGKTPRTFRELMAAHATQTACAGCHRKMDPLGYALDNFDAVGRWRDRDGDRPLDTTGVLPGGQRFTGPAELKQIILSRKDDFVRNLAEQMLVYALGRELSHADESTIREVTERLAKDNYRFTTLIQSIASSYPFRHRRNSGAGEE